MHTVSSLCAGHCSPLARGCASTSYPLGGVGHKIQETARYLARAAIADAPSHHCRQHRHRPRPPPAISPTFLASQSPSTSQKNHSAGHSAPAPLPKHPGRRPCTGTGRLDPCKGLEKRPEPALRLLFQPILQLSARVGMRNPMHPMRHRTAARNSSFPRTGGRNRCRKRLFGTLGSAGVVQERVVVR